MRPWTRPGLLTRYVSGSGAIAFPPRFLKSSSELALARVRRRPDSDTYRKVSKCP